MSIFSAVIIGFSLNIAKFATLKLIEFFVASLSFFPKTVPIVCELKDLAFSLHGTQPGKVDSYYIPILSARQMVLTIHWAVLTVVAMATNTSQYHTNR